MVPSCKSSISSNRAAIIFMAAIKDKNGQLHDANYYADKEFGGTTDISQVKPNIAVSFGTTVSALVFL